MQHLSGTHNPAIVILSIAIAFLASYAALDLASRITFARGRSRIGWLLGGSVTLGVGIWSMHGMAMLALSLPVAVQYDATLVILSVLLAIVGSAVGLAFATQPRWSSPLLGTAGLFMGAAVSGMHYTGMASMRLAASIIYSPAMVILSIGIAVAASCVALWLAFTLRRRPIRGVCPRRMGAAAVMGLAIAGMHYTGMHAAHFVASTADLGGGLLLGTRAMVEVTTLTTLLVLGVALAGSAVDRWMRVQAVHVERLAHTEAALRASDERYQLVGRATNDLIWDWDLTTGAMLLGNARDEEPAAGGRKERGMMPRAVDWSFSFIHPEDVARVQATIAEMQQSDTNVWAAEYRTQRRDGSYATVYNRAHIVRDAGGHPVRAIGAMMDISDRKRAEQALADARDAARAASRAKSEFLANMSHEIRTPMNGVLGMLGLVLDTKLTPDQREHLEVAQTSAESLLTVINDILDFSKVEAGKMSLAPETFRLRDALGDTVRTLALRAEQKGLELALNVLPDVPDSLHGDVNRLRQVVVNLVGNAIKFTEHGEVVVTVGMALHEPTEAPVPGEVTVHIAVADTGIGIPHDKQRLIFEAFTQADTSTTREYGGTGLGLTISSQLVALMGGRIWVESLPGKGSTFHFTVRAGRRLASGTTPTHGCRELLAGMRALIVDDNTTNRRILEQMTLGWQMQPTLVAGGAEALTALEVAERCGTPFRLILLDAQMPAMDGFDVAREISGREALAGVTVMMLSSSGRHADVSRCAELGIASYLTKPVKASHLLDAILRVIEAGPASVAWPPRPAEALRAPVARPLSVLLAEDNLVNQKLTVGLLAKRGHATTIAGNGRTAVDLFVHGSFDLILMDVQMPEMGGFEATQAIREHERATGGHIPIVAMTARAMTGDREQCLAAGMDAYLSKPIRPPELIALVEQWGGAGEGIPVVPSEAGDTARGESVFDEAGLLRLVGGDAALMEEIIQLFLDECPRLQRQLAAAARTGDATALQFAAHALKGSIGNMAAPRAYAAAAALESSARRGRLVATGSAMRSLEDEVSLLLADLAGRTATAS